MGKQSRGKKDKRTNITSCGNNDNITKKAAKFVCNYLKKLKLVILSLNLRLLIPIIISLFFISFFVYLQQSISTEIGGELYEFGNSEFSYDSYQGDCISPLCGCYKYKSEEWRGIIFCARNLRIFREGINPKSTYLLTTAEPSSINWGPPPYKFFKAHLYLISIPDNEAFNPIYLLNGDFPKTYKVIDKKICNEPSWLSICTKKELNLFLFSDVPLGSWIPAKGSKIKIEQPNRIYPHNKMRQDSMAELPSEWLNKYAPTPGTIIEEEFRGYNWKLISNDSKKLTLAKPMEFPLLDKPLEFPLGDFLGPLISIWVEDKNAIIKSDELLFGKTVNINNNKQIIAMVINPPFSMRLSCQPFDTEYLPEHFFNMNAEKLSELLNNLNNFGKIKIEIMNPRLTEIEYERMINKIKDKETIWVKEIPVEREVWMEGNIEDNYYKGYIRRKKSIPEDNIHQYGGHVRKGESDGKIEINYRFPPLPSKEGVNIYGQINYLKMSSAIGKLIIGTNTLDIWAPSLLEFRHIKNIKTPDGIITIPVKVDLNNGKHSAKFQANAEIFLNNKPIYKRKDENKFFLEYITLILAILAGIYPLIGYIKKSF